MTQLVTPWLGHLPFGSSSNQDNDMRGERESQGLFLRGMDFSKSRSSVKTMTLSPVTVLMSV